MWLKSIFYDQTFSQERRISFVVFLQLSALLSFQYSMIAYNLINGNKITMTQSLRLYILELRQYSINCQEYNKLSQGQKEKLIVLHNLIQVNNIISAKQNIFQARKDQPEQIRLMNIERTVLQAEAFAYEATSTNFKVPNQKLQVSVMQKQNIQNPETLSQQQNQFNDQGSPYGPFSQQKQIHDFELKNVKLILSHQIGMSPVQNYVPGPTKNSALNVTKQNYDKRTDSVLTQQSTHQLNSKSTQIQLQKQILKLAKIIRQKAKKKSLIKPCILNSNEASSKINSPTLQNKKLINNQRNRVCQKRQSQFQKYLYLRSVGIDLSLLEKQQQRLRASQYKKVARVRNQHIPSETLKQDSEILQFDQAEKRSSSKKQSSKINHKETLLPKLKLNFDVVHHRYRTTEFRKSILKEEKNRLMVRQLIIKEKEDALQKRRQIYNTSRYHPVGIKLSSLKLSKFQTVINNEITPNYHTHKNVDFIVQPQQIELNKIEQIQMKEQSLKVNIYEQQKSLNQQIKMNNPSEVKSSLTFNFSFSDPLNNLKQDRQIYKQIDNLVKQLQNDSTHQQKMNKLQKNKQIQTKKDDIQDKNWRDLRKDMTESKIIQQVQILHNSSGFQIQKHNHDKDIQLEYSYF